MKMKVKAKIKGADEMIARLERLAKPADVRRAVDKNTNEMEALMKRNAVFRKGYSEGETKASIHSEKRDSGYTGVVMPMTEYSVYLEYGTRNMTAQPFIRPTMWEQKVAFIYDIYMTLK